MAKRLPQATAVSPRYRAFLSGELTAEDLDWEELLRGQLRDDNGQFSGQKPRLLPRAWHDAIAREILHQSESKFRENYDAAMKALVDMVTSPRTPAREKLAAAQYIIERTIGKIEEKSKVQVEVTRFQELVDGGGLIIDLDDDKALPPGKSENFEDAEEVES